MEVINFKELVRRVHPDTNPHVTNAGKKMDLCIKYRKDPVKLKKLAIQWGIITDPNAKPKQKVTDNSWRVPPKPKHVFRNNQWDTTVRTGTTPRPHRQTQSVTLKANTTYCNGTIGYHSKYKKWYYVNKTTIRMVYYWDSVERINRKCSLNTMYLCKKQGR